MRVIIAILLLFVFALPAPAQPIPGAEAPAFAQARDLWLNGDDLPALQALGALARDGNTAAQMLLSQIATATHTHAHVTGAMDRRERIALLRQEGGLSGRDWMQAAAEVHPLATAYWSGRAPLDDDLQILQNVQLFMNVGDLKAALLALHEPLIYAPGPERYRRGYQMLDFYQARLGLAAQWAWAGALEQAVSLGPVRVPASVRTQEDFTAYIAEIQTPAASFAAFGVGAIWSHFFSVNPPRVSQAWTSLADYNSAVLDVINRVPDAAPITTFCTQTCPTSTDSCRVSIAESLTGGGRFPYPFASPSPTFVPDATYQASPRFLHDVERLARASTWRLPWQGCLPQ